MAVTMAHRLHSRTSLHGTSCRTPLHFRSSVARSRAPAWTQARTLWWWGRQERDWTQSSYDENLEERVRRHQRILRHRHSKMLRRRSMWEKDASSRFSWPWRMPSRWMSGQVQDVQYSSSPKASPTKLEGRNDQEVNHAPMTTFHKEFESFKEAVDKAIEKDTYSTLFGRRLQGPASANNSSWTSFSWIWDPKQIKEDPVDPRQPSAGPNKASPVHSQPFADPPSQPIPSAQSAAAQEYEYDPISMRKVPKTESTNPESSTKGILDSLFSEHGVDIPVKTYKPHKIYGHGGQPNGIISSDASTQQSKNSTFESNRKREFQAMKASALGSTIDTSPEFGGKVTTAETVSESKTSKRTTTQSEEPSDDAPLFSGTTYEGKSAEVLATRQPKSDWLLEEGFKSTGSRAISEENPQAPLQKLQSRIETSLDRISAQKSFSTVIQPALDRHLGTKGPRATRAMTNHLHENTEDVDLLRPHMVRANTKTARTTKQDVEQQKQTLRSNLDTDFAAREAAKETEDVGLTSYRFSAKLDGVVSKHLQENPGGVVARAFKTASDNLKKYDKISKPQSDSLEKSSSTDEAQCSIASTYRFAKKYPTPVTTFTPSKDVLRMDVLSIGRIEKTFGDTVQRDDATQVEKNKATGLAENVRGAHDEEAMGIDVHTEQLASSGEPLVTAKQAEGSHPLNTATVKEGVPRYPVIEAHVSTFEPRLARLVDDAKRIRRVMHDAQLHYRHLKDRMQRSPWSEVEKPASVLQSFAMLKEDPVEEDFPQGLDGPFISVRPSSETIETEKPLITSSLQPKIQEAIFTPPSSSSWNDEQPPPISELTNFQSLSSSYVLLRYRPKHDTVQVVPMSEPPPKTTTSLEGFDRLDNAAKFFTYFPGLLREGYEVVSGGQDFVLFKRSKGTLRPSVKMEDIAKQNPEPTKKPEQTSSKLLRPATSPRMAARLKEEQDTINSFIKVEDVKHTHGLNSFEVHSVLSQLAAEVSAGQQEDVKGLKGILGKLKTLRSRALTMDSMEFNTQAEALIKDVQILRAAQSAQEMTPSAPLASVVPGPKESLKMEAATVLDDIPQPTPGPAAPTAPPSSPISRPTIRQVPSIKQVPTAHPKPTIQQERPIQQEPLTEQESPKHHQPLSKPGEGPKARVRRQEDGFSGTMKSPPYRPIPSSPLSAMSRSPPAPIFEREPEAAPEPAAEFSPPIPTPTLPPLSAFKRFTRLVKRTIVTIIGAGVGAYVIGVVAEGLGAAEQQKLGQDGEGPRRKVVLPPPTRPGIYSTESSR